MRLLAGPACIVLALCLIHMAPPVASVDRQWAGGPPAAWPAPRVSHANDSWSLHSTTGIAARSAHVADVNMDGKADLVLAGAGAGISLLLNDGAGGWNASGAPGYAGIVNSIASGDLDLDGDVDIVAGGALGLRAWAREGGAWVDASTGLPSSGNFRSIVLADVDRDGDDDIVAAAALGAPRPYGVEVWLNSRAGAWTDGLGTLAVANSAVWVDCSDVNRDGYADIITGYESKGVSVHLGGAGHAWTYSSSGLPTAGSVTSVSAFDADGDGDMDILGSYGTSNGLRVWVGNGGASWTAHFGLPSNGVYNQAAPSDVDRDGRMDVVAARDGTGIEVWYGDGTLAWTEASVGLPDGDFDRFASGDVDADSWGDLVLLPASGSASAHRFDAWKTVNAWALEREMALGSVNPTSISLANLDYDPLPEVVLLALAKGIVIYDWQGSSYVQVGSPVSTGNYRSVDFGDFNRDGRTDIVATGNGIKAWMNNGAWSWTASSSGLPTTGSWVEHVRFADVHGDGKLDIVSSSKSNGGGRVYRGDGAGAWTATFGLTEMESYYSSAVADFNGDGDADLAFATDDGVVVFAGDSADVWTAWGPGFASGVKFATLSAGDADGDGDADLGASSDDGIPGTVGLCSADGNWNGAWEIYDSIDSMTLLDFTLDGKLDAIGMRAGSPLALALEDGSFTNLSTGLDLTMPTSAVCPGDADGDGWPDLAVACGLPGAYFVRVYGGRRVAPSIPAVPGDITGSLSGETNATVAWSPSVDEGSGGFEGYAVFHSDSYDSGGAGYEWIADLPRNRHSYLAESGAPGPDGWSFYIVVSRGAGGGRSVPGEQGYLQGVGLNAGWTLASTSFSPVMTVADLAGQSVNLICVETYDAREGGWLVWARGMPSFLEPRDMFRDGRGYWLRSDVATSVTFFGTARATFAFDLVKGWNLVAHPFVNPETLALSLTGLPWDIADGYSPADAYKMKPMAGAAVIDPGTGFWIHLTEESTWSGVR